MTTSLWRISVAWFTGCSCFNRKAPPPLPLMLLLNCVSYQVFEQPMFSYNIHHMKVVFTTTLPSFFQEQATRYVFAPLLGEPMGPRDYSWSKKTRQLRLS